jgi:hypothetical protein
MSPSYSYLQSRQPGWFTALFIALVLAACGGGVDSGGTGAPASSASGPITGFGSVIVNGVHYDESRANISDADGRVLHSDDLRLGMTALIRGSALVITANETRSAADSIVISNAIVGPIDNIDTGAGTVTVLDQTVQVSSMTLFDDSTSGLSALSPGDVIEVFALLDASNGPYNATRIERKTGVSAYELRGIVSNLDTAIRMFNIGNLKISYAGIAQKDVPPSLGNGRPMRVRMRTSTGVPVRIATLLQDGVSPLAEQEEARIEGMITNFVSSRQFSVEGVAIDASQASMSGNGGWRAGSRVSVEGIVRGGVLVADKAKSKSKHDVESEGFELDGKITALDTASKILLVHGVSVDYSGIVEFRDGTIADLAVGKNVEIKGTLSADPARVEAVRIEFKH